MPGSHPCEPGCECQRHNPRPRKRKPGIPETEDMRRERRRAANLWAHHRLRPEQWDAIWSAQQGRCYLCGDPLSHRKNQTHIDHDHSCCPPRKSCSFCRRGLACTDCNAIIGHAKDDPERLRRIADMLEMAIPATLTRMADKPVQDELPVGV